MSVAVLDVPESPRSATLQGRELIEGRRRLDVGEAEWLLSLAAFDLWGTWAEDGHSSCVAWLVERCGMARRTAIEKLRVAKELDRRPALAAALSSGEVSYAKARAVSRYDGANPGVEAELIAAAAELTNEELERAVRYARGLHEQEKDPTGRYDRRGVSRCYGVGGGMGRLIIDGPDDDIERIANLLDAQADATRRATRRDRVRSGNADDDGVRSGNADDDGVRSGNADDDGVRSGNADDDGVRSGNADDDGVRSGNPLGATVRSGNADESGEAEEQSPEDPAARTTIVQRRYDALVDLLEVGAAHHHDTIDVERAAIGVTIDYRTLVERAPGHADLASGVTLTGETVRRLACDGGIHRIIVKGASEILDVGQKTRHWNRAQRRAIAARHGHQCAIRGCGRRVYEIHHIQWVENGGATDIVNGVPLCFAHHHLVHDGGWIITYDEHTGSTTLTGPAGQTIHSRTRLSAA